MYESHLNKHNDRIQKLTRYEHEKNNGNCGRNNTKEIFTTVEVYPISKRTLYIKNFIGIDVLLIFLPCPIGLGIFSKDTPLKKRKNGNRYFLRIFYEN